MAQDAKQTGGVSHEEDAHHHHHEHHHHDCDAIDLAPHQHAFFVVGERQLYLVHMGNMWMAPHRFQMVLKIGVTEEVRAKIVAERAQNGGWYIIGNDADSAFALPSVPQGTVRSFVGSLWHGMPTTAGTPHWPWANQPPVLGHFPVRIEQIVYYRPLDFNLDYPRTATYLVFGTGGEAHLHHLITRQPDYDHVLTLKHAPDWLPPSVLESGAFVNFPQIPAIPVESSAGVYTQSPVRNGSHQVQFCGYGPSRPMHVESTVFFGTWPINERDPARP